MRDFLNTHDVEERVDDLATPGALAAWLEARKLRTGPTTPTDLVEATALREGLRAALRTAAHDGMSTPRTLDDLAARFPLRLSFAGPRPALAPVAAGVRGGLAGVLAAAAACVHDGSWTRLKVCSSDTCQWAFYDTSRNRTRAWCSMRVCGNRQKTRAYRGRRREEERSGAR